MQSSNKKHIFLNKYHLFQGMKKKKGSLNPTGISQ